MDHLTVNCEDCVILKDKMIVLPRVFHRIVGSSWSSSVIQKTKVFMQTKVLSVSMDIAVANEKCNSVACQATSCPVHTELLKPAPLPENIWEMSRADFMGPLPDGKYL